MLQGKYDEAKEQYDIHYKLNKNKNDYYTKRAKEQSTNVTKKIKKVGESVGLEVKHINDLDINSMYAEYAPCQYNDSIFFFAGVRPLDAKLADTSFIYANYLTRVIQATLSVSNHTAQSAQLIGNECIHGVKHDCANTTHLPSIWRGDLLGH